MKQQTLTIGKHSIITFALKSEGVNQYANVCKLGGVGLTSMWALAYNFF